MTGDDLIYEYIDPQAPEKKINYSYSEFYGFPFLSAWRTSRLSYLKGKVTPNLEFCYKSCKEVNWKDNEFVDANLIFDSWITSIKSADSYRLDLVLLLIKRFEVTRKIYTNYSDLMRPEDNTRLGSMALFGKWGVVLALVFRNTGRMPALNALIKVNDILLSNTQEIPKQALKSVSMEVGILEEIIHSKLDFRW